MLNMNFGNVIESNNSLICYAKKALPFENHTESVKINDNQVLIAEKIMRSVNLNPKVRPINYIINIIGGLIFYEVFI